MIRIGRVPIERAGHRSFRDAHADHVSHVRRLFGMDGNAIVNGRVSGHHDHIAPDGPAEICFDRRLISTGDFGRVSLAEDTAAVARERTSQAGEIVERMKLPLFWKPERRTSVKRFDRRTRDQFHIGQTGAVRGFQFVFKYFRRLAWWHEQVAVEPFEAAIELFLTTDLFDLVYCRRGTRGDETRAGRAVELLHLHVTIVESVR